MEVGSDGSQGRCHAPGQRLMLHSYWSGPTYVIYKAVVIACYFNPAALQLALLMKAACKMHCLLTRVCWQRGDG